MCQCRIEIGLSLESTIMPIFQIKLQIVCIRIHFHFHFFCSAGIRDAFDPQAVLQLIPLGVGEVKIQGLESGLYLAMNSKGNLYAEPDESNDATVFLESSSGVVYARDQVSVLVTETNTC